MKALFLILALATFCACGAEEATSEEIKDCCRCLAQKDARGATCLEYDVGREDLVINRCWDDLRDGRAVSVQYRCLKDDVCGGACWMLGEG